MKINLQEQIDLAMDLVKKDDAQSLDQALNIFNAVFNIDKDNSQILFMIAVACMKKEYNALAIELYRLVISKDKSSWNAWFNLGFAYKKDELITEARAAFETALTLQRQLGASDKDMSDCMVNLGSTYVAQGTPDTALRYIESALTLVPNNPDAFWNGSLALLEKGEYEKGWRWYSNGVRATEKVMRNYTSLKTPEWNGATGKTVVVYGEQGIGDEIMFASMIPDLMQDCSVIFDAHPRLYKIFRQSFPTISIYGTRKDKEISWPQIHAIDACIPLASLGKFYRNKTSDFPGTPYLKADEILKEKYQLKLDALGPRPKIGLSWRGGTKQTNLKQRIIPLEMFLTLFDELDAEFISLQYTKGAMDEIKSFSRTHGHTIHHWQDAIDDYDETAALVSALDYVISVPQSVVHLAGALGVPTLQLTPKQAMWQMGVYGQDMPWYGCVSNIWQTKAVEWKPVIDKATEVICNLFQMNTKY